jgi:predicted amidophosphoribosyltransferase
MSYTQAPTPDPNSLPDPRDDGVCANCLSKPAVTRDGRFCSPCLKKMVRAMNPGATWPTRCKADQQHGYERDPSPWGEIAVRAMEDG